MRRRRRREGCERRARWIPRDGHPALRVGDIPDGDDTKCSRDASSHGRPSSVTTGIRARGEWRKLAVPAPSLRARRQQRLRGLARCSESRGILAADSCSAKVALLTAASWRRVLAADRQTTTAPSRPARRRRARVPSRRNATPPPARKGRQSIPRPAGRCSSTLSPRLAPRTTRIRARALNLARVAARPPGVIWRCRPTLLEPLRPLHCGSSCCSERVVSSLRFVRIENRDSVENMPWRRV